MLGTIAAAVLSLGAAEPTHRWNWNYYFTPGMPAGTVNGQPLTGTLILPDGRGVKAQNFAFPESGSMDLMTVLKPHPERRDRTIVTSDFNCTEPERIVLGLGVNGKTKLYFNGKLIFDSTIPGNSERPVSYTNHMVELNCRAGNNQLIWELFRGGGTFTLAAKLRDYPVPALRYQPWAMFPDSRERAVSIVFATTHPTPAGVDFRIKGTEKWQRAYNNLSGCIRRDTAVHHIRLTDLEPEKWYEYRAVLIDEANSWREIPQKEIHTFKTVPAVSKPFTVTLSSDLQVSPALRAQFLNDMFKIPGNRESSFFAFVGDINWTSNFEQIIMDEFVNLFRTASGNKLPLVMVRGNHEIYGNDSDKYFKYFKTPRTVEHSFFMFSCGDVCFVVLDFLDDAPRLPAPSTRSKYDYAPHFKKQQAWLKQVVKSEEFRKARFRVVLCHAVPLGDHLPFQPGNVRRGIEPLFASKNPAHRIHLWVGGHTHRAFRSIPLQNTARSVMPVNHHPKIKHPPIGIKYPFTVAVMGGPNRSVNAAFTLTSMQLKFKENTLELMHYDRNGKLFDHIKIAPDGKVTEVFSDNSRYPRYKY